MVRFAIICGLAGCWRGGSAPATLPAPTKPAPAKPPPTYGATVRAVTCTDGRSLLMLAIPTLEGPITVELSFKPGDPVPKSFDDVGEAEMSPCLHGCSPGHFVLEQLEVGKRLQGTYQIVANAGPTYEGAVDATWLGTPWEDDGCRGRW